MVELREGDRIQIVSNKVGQPTRAGVVDRVLEEDPVRVEVTWDDGSTTEFIPAGGNVRLVHSRD
ncbi:hypothetical protein [Nitriliruptor alkaliphilus]|uniref:hypothetical protein n=1 Tax=Nitriliruptor alkaliphilus TaxID=427918 RepID=UPI0006966BE7|nr:hypothetical protein [Nitriliruptor alkaliphilus]